MSVITCLRRCHLSRGPGFEFLLGEICVCCSIRLNKNSESTDPPRVTEERLGLKNLLNYRFLPPDPKKSFFVFHPIPKTRVDESFFYLGWVEGLKTYSTVLLEQGWFVLTKSCWASGQISKESKPVKAKQRALGRCDGFVALAKLSGKHLSCVNLLVQYQPLRGLNSSQAWRSTADKYPDFREKKNGINLTKN